MNRRERVYFWALLVQSCLLGCATLMACRKDSPPAISIICTLDGHGGGDCSHPDGSHVYLVPSAMANFWCTTQADEEAYTKWCYNPPGSK